MEQNSRSEQADFLSSQAVTFESMLVDCLGCKWTLLLLNYIDEGVDRPGKLVKLINGLTTKVLNENLTRMQTYGLIEKLVYDESPPKVQYKLTQFGLKLREVLEDVKRLQGQFMDSADR